MTVDNDRQNMDNHPLSPNLGGPVAGDVPPVDYLTWYVARLQSGVKHDLSQSGLHYPWDWKGMTGDSFPEDLTNPFTTTPLDPRLLVAEREGVHPSQVAGGHGVSQTLCLALLAIANPEKPRKVAVEMPSYAPVSQFPRTLGFEVLPFWRGPKDSSDCGPWEIDRKSLTKIIGDVCAVVTTPAQNPTGWMMSESDQRWLSDLCLTEEVGLVSDEVYIDTMKETSDYRPMHLYGDHCVSVNSLTKCYGLGPLRVGWLIGSKYIAERAGRALFNIQGSLATPSLRLAQFAWPHLEDPLNLIIERREKNIPILLEVLKKHAIEWTPPPSGIFGCIALPENVDSQRFVEDICWEKKLLATPCLMFAPTLTHFLRIAWGEPHEEFVEAMKAFDLCLQELK